MTAASTSPLATERSAPALTKNQIRGAGLRTLLRVLEDQESSADFQRIVAQLPDEVRQLAETRLIAAAHWFPLQWYAAVHEAADRVCRRGPRYARRLGYLGAERDLKSIYRLFLKVV